MKLIQLARSGNYVRYSEIFIDDDSAGNPLRNVPDDGPSPEQMAEAREEFKTIMACLTDKQRAYLLLLYEGYKPAEIAEKMNVNYGYLRNMLTRIRKRLKENGYGLEN